MATAESGNPPSRPVMLIVDDDLGVLNSIAREMRDRYSDDYRILPVSSGVEAIETTKELKLRGDEVALFLTDQRMPTVTGIELLKETLPLFPDAKRVLLTGYADTQVAIAGINEVGLDHYLGKPWGVPEDNLYPVVDDLMGDWQSQRRLKGGVVRVVGQRWSAAVSELRDFLILNQVPHNFLDADTDPEGAALRAALDPETQLPAVVFPDGKVLGAPDRRTLAEAANLVTGTEATYHDLIVIGAGPAGLAAAVYGASEGLSTLVVERWAVGGQAGTSSKIENYLGFPNGISGSDLARRAGAQARRLGAEVITAAEVASIESEEPMRVVTLGDGRQLRARTVVLASGMTVKSLSTPGLERLRGSGVYYGAAPGEARLYENEDVVVIGGANSAGQAARMLARHARSVRMVVRAPSLDHGMSHYLVEQIEALPNIEVMTGSRTIEVCGEDRVSKVRVQTGEESAEFPATGVFVFVGAVPHSAFVKDIVELSEEGFVLTGPDLWKDGKLTPRWPLERPPFFLETSMPGIFAAGDVRYGSVRRVASAVGSGAASLTFVHKYLDIA